MSLIVNTSKNVDCFDNYNLYRQLNEIWCTRTMAGSSIPFTLRDGGGKR